MKLLAAPSTSETELSLNVPFDVGAQVASSASTCARCAHRIVVVGRCGCIGSSCLQPSEQQFEPAGKLELSRRARQHCVPVPGWASEGLLVGTVWRCTCELCYERW